MFLFQSKTLIDATPLGRNLLRKAPDNGAEWEKLVDLLAAKFPDVRAAVRSGETNGLFHSPDPDDDSFIEIESWGDKIRVTLHEAQMHKGPVHPLAITAMEDELKTLREISEHAPQLMWKEDSSHSVTWANKAYLALADRVEPNAGTWPPKRIFETIGQDPDGQTRRQKVEVDGAPSLEWFDVVSLPQSDGTLHFATDAGTAVEAEEQARKFVQTLTKTFAQLSIGLAIFDKQRRLVMFNPALLDLTGLPVGFLSSRPLIHSVLDRLRDRNMLPEPTNYKNWREQVSALETAAAAGTYCENWYLPGGQTYRVTGRPHPDGAIAFTFEDITAEISLTRHFRSKLETSQGVIEAMDEAIAVFSATGTLQMNNAAYAAFWGQSAEGIAEINLHDELSRWKELTAPSNLWQSVTKLPLAGQTRLAHQETLRMTDGRPARCRVVPLNGGATMVAFKIISESKDPSDKEHEYADLPVLTYRSA
ncbi:PAS-domain containing protein [Flavimaricola marinus]|nr:PAS-domain containing protein [Flavimaricola marinus]